MMWQEVLMA